MGRCSFGWTSSRCQRLLSNKSLAYAGTSSRLGMLGRALLLWLLGNLFAYLRQKEAFDCSISKLATWVFLQNSFGISISNLILSGCVGCTISTCAMELFGLLLPTILPLPNGSLLSSLKTAPSGTVEVNLGVLHWWVAGILEWINLCLMLITSFDHLARQSHGKELYGKSGLSQSTASSCGWQFSGSFELEICYLFFLVIPFVCSASMRGSRMTIFFLHVNGHPACGARLSPGCRLVGAWRLCIVLCVVWGLGKAILKLGCEEFPWAVVSTLYGKKGTSGYLKESVWGLIESSGDFKSYSTQYSTSMQQTTPDWMLAEFILLLLLRLQASY